MLTYSRVPPHLRCHLVEQDYGAYDEIDQAVWRFTLQHTHAVLKDTAHPAYREGLARTGIDLERIPHISDMDRRLSDLGWGAVGVDGFIPPRAFQQLQANSILPIAVDIRRHDHLAYTPAPDIIHEAAGHAPILADPEYGEFLRRIGEVGYRAFALPHDHLVYQAIYALSVVKERVDATPGEIRASEQALADAIAAAGGPSEAARVARLYWWTVEYGLVGTPRDYRIYGAGLLSSLGESHFCHAREVAKLPLDVGCLDVDYDITRAQPQLFVAENFAHLGTVLSEVRSRLSQANGGAHGVETAIASGEVATLRLTNGLEISGRPSRVERRDNKRLHVWFAAGWTASQSGVPLPGYGRGDHDLQTLCLCLGAAVPKSLAPGIEVELPLADGGSVAGTIRQALHASLASPLAWCAGPVPETNIESSQAVWLLVDRGAVAAAAAGPAYDGFFDVIAAPRRVAPAPKSVTPERSELLGMYQRAYDAWHRQLGTACIPLFASLHARLVEAYPNEWLLRWNLLESLTTLGERSRLTRDLANELTALERAFDHREPIATGLRSLRRAKVG